MLKYSDDIKINKFSVNFIMNHHKSQSSHSKIMEALTIHFPHLKSLMINPEASLTESLENIISHITQPDQVNLLQVITGMKQAVDQQQLKIQKSLVNSQPLSNVTNIEQPKKWQNKIIEIIQMKQESEQNYQIRNQNHDEIIQQIWRWDQEQNRNKYWFKN